MGRPIAAGALT